ncbi:hypothetical protein FRC11_005060 [Ceratobasidium sp. 423]|nr:hypothetical protein FRC11_005060 [Ceratobasidium sp. 423]
MGDPVPINGQTERAASLSQAAESLARAAAKLSEAARAMSLVAEALSKGTIAKSSGIKEPDGKTPQPDRPDAAPSSDAAAAEDEGVGLPQPYRLLLDDEAEVLLVLCSLVYDLPKVVCYFACGAPSLKVYKSLIDGVAETKAIIPDSPGAPTVDLCVEKFLKERRSIILLSEADIPSTQAKEASEYAVIHVGWPTNKRQYVAQRRAHHAATNIMLAYSGDKDVYPSGSAIMSQTIAWPGDTGGFRASVDILRPLFEERLSEVSFEMKEEVYLTQAAPLTQEQDWIHLHSSQGSRSISSWTPSELVNRANRFILGPLAYRSPGSLAQRSTLQTPLADLLPEVSAEFVTQHGLQPAVDEGLLRVETDAGVDDTHEPNSNSASQSAEDTRTRTVSEAPFSQSVLYQTPIGGHSHADSVPTVTGPPRFTVNFELATGQTYFALEEEFDSIPLIYFLSMRFKKTILFLEGSMLKSYKSLFHKFMKQQILVLKYNGDPSKIEETSLEFTTSTSPSILLVDHTINALPSAFKRSAIGCWIYWVHDFNIEIAKRFRLEINCVAASIIIPSSRRDRLVAGISGFKEHPQSSLILGRNEHSPLEPARCIVRSVLSAGGSEIRGLYNTRIISLRVDNFQEIRSVQEAVRLANHYAARVLLHGSPEDGSRVFPPIAQRPWLSQVAVNHHHLQPAVYAGLLSVK